MVGSLITVGVAREGLSPENPSESNAATDLRVAINPAGVERFLEAAAGFPVKVCVEEGAGIGVGYTREMFENAGARIVSTSKLYAQSDIVFKLKGPPDANIRMMKPGALLGCFAHLETFPGRAQAARDAHVNVLALEEILQSPKIIPSPTAFARGVALDELQQLITERAGGVATDCEVICHGFTPELFAFAQQASRMGCRVSFINDETDHVSVDSAARAVALVYDSSINLPRSEIFEALVTRGESLLNLHDFEDRREEYCQRYLQTQHAALLGKRRVECLNETGMCGARYGFELLEKKSPLALKPDAANVVVLGYGHVARGAVQESLRLGVSRVHIVGKEQICRERITPYLESANLIINGIDLGADKGKTYVVTERHIHEQTVKPGSVVIDLVGGSKQEPSAVEAIRECTFLDDPYFELGGVFFSALWGWPMMYMMRESSDAYSEQITDLFVGEPDFLIKGFHKATLGVTRALFVPSRNDATQAPSIELKDLAVQTGTGDSR